MTMLYTIIIMMALTGLASLAVDLGRVQVAKFELRDAADAAARYAVTGLSDNTYVAKAQASAAENTVDTTPLALLSSDISAGRWSSGAFTVGGTPFNAVRVTAYRTAARSTAIPLMWGSLVGRTKCDVTATAVTIINYNGGNAMVGMNSASISTSGIIDSYNANDGTYSSGSSMSDGNVASNGTVTLGGGAKVYGNAYYRSGYSATGGAQIMSPGSSYYMSSAVSYPDPVLPGSYTNYGAFSASSGTYYVAPGNYYFSSLTLSGSVSMVATGQVFIYVGGPVSISGDLSNTSGIPGNFHLMTTTSTTVNISTNAGLCADIYCPNSAVTIGGTGSYYGRWIGKTLSVSGSESFHYDESLNTNLGSGSISIVK